MKSSLSITLFSMLFTIFTTTVVSAQEHISQNGNFTVEPSRPQVPGHYQYTHSWSYAVGTDSIYCSEEGTMDFFPNGTALDHATQHYLLVRQDKSRVTWDFDYYSPSYWRLEGEDFYFSGDSVTFKMECISQPGEEADASWYYSYAKGIADNVRRSINYETRFHLAELTGHRIVWSYTYKDGHTDTWEFYKH